MWVLLTAYPHPDVRFAPAGAVTSYLVKDHLGSNRMMAFPKVAEAEAGNEQHPVAQS